MSFTPLLERGLMADCVLSAWCPTMDLIAIATTDGGGAGRQLHVHRLNWQRLWWFSPDAAITALEWRPDGKQLAVGLEDGTVLLLNTEDGEVQHRRQLLPDALVAISWTEAAAAGTAAAAAAAAAAAEGGGSATSRSSCGAGPQGQPGAAATAAAQLCQDRARRMFAPPPPPVPTAAALAADYSASGKRGSGGGASQAWPAQSPRLAVLALASSAGELALCTSALFPLAALHLPSLLGRPSVSVLRLATAPSLQQLAVCWRGGDGGGAGGDGTADPVNLSMLSMRHVGAHAPQLHRLALAAAHVGSLLEGCQQSLQAACKEWQGGQRELQQSRGRLADLMSDYGVMGKEPASELQSLLATGAVGGALQQYITATLGEPGLKKLARALDAAVCAVHTLLSDHLQPQLEQLAFRLGELRGLALCLPWRRITGLQPDQVSSAEQAALRLVMSAEAARRRVVQAGAQYRTFFSWLLIVMRRMQEDAADALVGYPRSHLDTVSDFLAGQYRQDTVGPMLGSAGGGGSSEGAELSIGGGGGGEGGGGRGAAAEGAATGGAAVGAAAAAASGSGVSGGSMVDLVMEVLGRQALVQAADSTASPSNGGWTGQGGIAGGGNAAAGGSSLAQLLSGLQAACAAMFNRTTEVISPTVHMTRSFSLGPAPCALASAYLASGAGSRAAAAAATALSSSAVAVACGDQQRVLVVRGNTEQQGPAGDMEAAVLQVPQGQAAADLAFYKEGQLALLLAGNSGEEKGPCRLALLPQEQLQFVRLPAELLAGCESALQLCQLLLEGGAGAPVPLPEGCRQRALPCTNVQPPLAVSASRGVACMLAGAQRVLLYDLEEDEEEEEEEEEEELADAHEGHDMDSDAAFESPLSR